jgi:hypothetical protein
MPHPLSAPQGVQVVEHQQHLAVGGQVHLTQPLADQPDRIVGRLRRRRLPVNLRRQRRPDRRQRRARVRTTIEANGAHWLRQVRRQAGDQRRLADQLRPVDDDETPPQDQLLADPQQLVVAPVQPVTVCDRPGRVIWIREFFQHQLPNSR